MIIKDKNSLEWLQVKEFCEKELTRLREQNDSHLDLAETENIRGEIAFAKRILNLDKAETKPDVSIVPAYVD